MRYVVPYSAPGIKWGQLRLDAESSAEALDRAREIHASAVRLSRVVAAGYGSSTGSYYHPTLRLHKKKRSQIVYGELHTWLEDLGDVPF